MRSVIKTLMLFALVLEGCATSVEVEPCGTVQGFVLTWDNAPIRGAMVWAQEEPEHSTTTNELGFFTISDVRVGSRLMMARIQDGSEGWTRVENWDSGFVANIEIKPNRQIE